MKKQFEGLNAIVTGGTRGIGRATSEMLLRDGAAVTAVYGGDDASAAAFAAEWSDYPLTVAKLDVADYVACEVFFLDYEQKHDSLDILVNSAGIRIDSVLGMMKPMDWERVLAVNLTGSFNVCKFAVHQMMSKRNGRIVCVTSPSGRLGFAGQCNYAASKAGQVAMIKSLSKEVARRGITANCVSPGFIETELIADLSEDLIKEYRSHIPMRRFGKPEEIAEAIRFLVSREASYITGTVLEVSGGL
ncbi:MAG: 3-oxoacyl-ACP reductase FabG [Victivallaceae bacterium]|nr:3-oxoacyl-ACP reductase FabG [Victivallaceae bacterium]MDD4181114.1 3-oxoacyl-ACP reductase FabG [Victivallaceae bacterium]